MSFETSRSAECGPVFGLFHVDEWGRTWRMEAPPYAVPQLRLLVGSYIYRSRFPASYQQNA